MEAGILFQWKGEVCAVGRMRDLISAEFCFCSEGQLPVIRQCLYIVWVRDPGIGEFSFVEGVCFQYRSEDLTEAV